jgi:hypothetical protein
MESKKDLDLLVENFFKPKKKKALLNLGALLEMVEKAMDADAPLLREDAQSLPAGAKKFPLPKLRITEAWGRAEGGDREIIEKYSRNIPGDTLQAKLQYLTDVIEGNIVLHDVQPIISTLVMIEVLSTILADYTESGAGFIFEGFLAGLFGDQSVQVTDVSGDEAGATGKPITDVRLGGKEYSLKLLGPATEVKGSFKNMVEHFKSGKTHVVYLDARRINKTEGLEFSEFLITLDNFLEVFVTPFLHQVEKKETETYKDAAEFQALLKRLQQDKMAVKRIQFANPTKTWKKETGLETGFLPGDPDQYIFEFSPTATPPALQELKLNGDGMSSLVSRIIEMDPEQLQPYGHPTGFKIRYTEARFEGTKAEKLFGSMAVVQQLQRAIDGGNREEILKSLMKTPGYGHEHRVEQFVFTPSQTEKIGGFKVIAKLPLGQAALQKAWMNYAELLNTTIAPVYQFLGMYDESITNYFTGEGDNRNAEATKAVSAAEGLRAATDEAVAVIGKAAEREK